MRLRLWDRHKDGNRNRREPEEVLDEVKKISLTEGEKEALSKFISSAEEKLERDAERGGGGCWWCCGGGDERAETLSQLRDLIE